MTIGAIGGYNTYLPHTSPATPVSQTGRPEELHPQDKNAKVDKSSPSYECQTCANRKYQDGSNEADVSFKAASHVSPEAAASAVRSHEQMHVANAYQKASQNNGKVLAATVSIHTSVCPECGRSYVSGGTTQTKIKYTNETNPYQQELKAQDATRLRGANIDMIA